jgi:hypothetical protein
MDWRYNTVWFDQLPAGEVRMADFGKGGTGRETLLGGKYLNVRGFKSKHKNFEDFPANGSVKYVELSLSNITSFKGVSVLGKVKRVEVHYCLKLENDHGLSEISDSIEWLHINQSKKFSIGDELIGLSNLKVLCLNRCAPLQNLEFLDRFPQLLDFRFVDTNVIDGDLTPILRHPTLCSLGTLDKRHYNMRSDDLQNNLATRRAAAIAIARNGPWETFRYTAIRSR